MKRSPVTEQVEGVSRLEDELEAARKKAAQSLRDVRAECGLSLRDLAPLAGLAASALSTLERGESWYTPTARRVAEVLVERCPDHAA